MRVLVTFPGKFGDLLWALPTLRALSRRLGHPIDLLTSREMASICPLLRMQAYLGNVIVDDTWIDADCAPVQRRMPPGDSARGIPGYDQVIHLGYPDWPNVGLPYYILKTANRALTDLRTPGVTVDQWIWLTPEELTLDDPWITLPQPPRWSGIPWVHGFSDEHFELKFGLVYLLAYSAMHWKPRRAGQLPPMRIGSSPRWNAEGGETPNTWETTVELLQSTMVCVACNSGLHVLAVACGVPVVMMEPSEARWNPIFYPVGDTGPQVTLVRGNDGRPTFDARHVHAVLSDVLARRALAQVDSTTSPDPLR